MNEDKKYVLGCDIGNGYGYVSLLMNENEDPRETLLDYVITINDELTNKREEFGLPTKASKK